MGRDILDRQEQAGWGSRVIDRLATDLRAKFPDQRGCSRSNLHRMRALAAAWPDVEVVPQAVGQLPWGHSAGLRGPDGTTLHVTPHQLRHTYGTELINGGMSLPALMALLGHVSAQMTLRYAALASPTVRAAYDQAMSKARRRLTLPIAPVGQAIVPDRVQWLRGEMLKTRVAHGYCSRNLVADACSYANIPSRVHGRRRGSAATSRSWSFEVTGEAGDDGRIIEIFFGIITRQAIRRGTFTSVKDLISAIETFIDGWNERCQPFT